MLVILTCLLPLLVLAPPTLAGSYQWQDQRPLIDIGTGESWQKYVRSPPSAVVRPSRVLGTLTRGNVTNAEGLLTGKGSTILTRTLPKSASMAADASDVPPAVVVDWGQNMAGFVSIKFGGSFNTTPGLPGIRLAFSETLQFLSNRSDFSRSDNIAVRPTPYTWTDKYGCEFGDQVCADGLHGFRYMKIYLDALPADAPYTSSYGQVNIDSMSLEFTGFLGTPNTFTGWFESSDDQLNQWWYDGVYTNDLCIDTFRENDTDPRGAGSPTLMGKLVLHDGANRDRDPYVGDLAVASRTSYLSHSVAAATRNVLADIADHQRADGWLPPASIQSYTLPLYDYPLWWVACSYDLFMYTGDTAYVTNYYPNLVKVLDTFYPSTTDPATGLLRKGLGGTGGYGDYAFLPRSGPVTYYNALYVMALDNAASMARYLGHEADVSRWSARARKVSQALDGNFDPKAGAFYDGTCGKAFCQTHAQDGNSLSIVSGVANSTRAESILAYLSANHERPYGNAFYDNDLLGPFSQRVYAFISYFEIEARFRTGLAASALEEIRRLYGWMSTHDPKITMWEGIGPKGEPYEDGFTSMAHGWGTGVVPALTNYVLGVMPSGPGFSTWAVKPIPGDVRWAKGLVPTPKGPIKVSWNHNDAGLFYLQVTGPAGTRGVVSVPRGDKTNSVYFDSQAVQGDTDKGYVNVAVEGGATHNFSVGFKL
ncbi:alpha-L-rhamnosidase [Drepanopeziza brunnea f. sp. 'multigermtubi' MB_m1]|uniref:Alpha-L-rhamnosidase n=1 Tax=Marssonina brunnea f. sp. multigermtubi (strain MB_m1) TaxID=1072389 RepID=K1WK45_MARBU|nr:alpha-L-rhamnosidase [Drepanopeziza brunnea f. sp. 'multigermtubi' MB_m1]EKD12592.1 alpha-L-rhamnosidase [Drepanopeziza brunnea f. sp. 'multigermtubi' MB_m1]